MYLLQRIENLKRLHMNVDIRDEIDKIEDIFDYKIVNIRPFLPSVFYYLTVATSPSSLKPDIRLLKYIVLLFDSFGSIYIQKRSVNRANQDLLCIY
jgi:hypothetical protein